MDTNIEILVEKVNAHIFEIKMTFTAQWDNTILEMPSWTPGSYLIREYARHVQHPTANTKEGKLNCKKVTKNNWQFDCGKGESIVFSYEIYAFELTVRTSYLDNRKGLIVPASMFFYQVDPLSDNNNKGDKINISIQLPEGWKQYSSLRTESDHYFVDDFDEFVDTPIALGVSEVVDVYDYSFKDGETMIPNKLVIIGDKFDHNIEKFALDLQKLQLESIRMFGELPYDRYVWLLYIVDKSGGGLEHKFSNCSIIPRWNFTDEEKYNRLLSLEAHEHFHVYNVKRIRPTQLGPFNYSNEVYTKLLWIAEGLTSFYDNIQLPRADLITEKQYWEIIAKDLQSLYSQFGRFVLSIEEASFDAWIRLYRPNENSQNSSISYYLKGGIVGLMLDIELRLQSKGQHSLDTFYNHMYKLYKKDPKVGFEEDEIQSIMELATNTDLEDFWTKYISGTQEVDVDQYLEHIGMALKKTYHKLPFTGINFKDSTKKVQSVDFDSPAMKAGIYAFDEIVAIQDFKAKDNYETILEKSLDKGVEIALFRDGKLIYCTLIPTKPIVEKIEIMEIEDASIVQLKLRNQFFERTV